MPRRREVVEESPRTEYPRSQWPFKAAGVVLLLFLMYWLLLGGGIKWFMRQSAQATPTATLSPTGEVCVQGASPTSISCGETCGTATFQKVGLGFSCWGGQVAVLPNLQPRTPATFTLPAGKITVIFPAVNVEVPLVHTAIIETAQVRPPEAIVRPTVLRPTPEPTPRAIAPPIKVSPPMKVSPPVKPAPAQIVRRPMQVVKRTCTVELSFTVSAMFARSRCFGGTVEWGESGGLWQPMHAREVGSWYESNVVPTGSRVCFWVNKNAYCADRVEGGGTYTFTRTP